MTVHTVEVRNDPETGDPFIEFPDEFMDKLDWKEGDTLIWEEQSDGSWTVRKG